MQSQTKHDFWFAVFAAILFALAFAFAASADESYNRREWLPYWIDADKDCQSTRQEVLIRDSLIPVQLDSKGCKVLSGLWEDPYSGARYSLPNELDVEHIIPIFEANKSGGNPWPIAKKRTFSNELYGYNLIAVHRSLNRSKGSKTPQSWRPPNRAYWCEYARRWEAVKLRWGLSIAPEERSALVEMVGTCIPEPAEIEA